MIQGSLIGLLGTLMGVALGVLIALNVGNMAGAIEALFGFIQKHDRGLVDEALRRLRSSGDRWLAIIADWLLSDRAERP